MLLKGNPKEEKGRAPRVWPRGSGVREGGVPLRRPPPPRGGSTPELPGSGGRSRTTGGRGQQRQLRPGVEEKGRERSSGKGKRGKMGLSQGTGAKAILVKTGALHALNLLCPGLVGFFCRFLRSTARPPAPAPRLSPSVGGGGDGTIWHDGPTEASPRCWEDEENSEFSWVSALWTKQLGWVE